MERAYYSNTIEKFATDDRHIILGQLVQHSEFAVEQAQRDAWLAQIDHLQAVLRDERGLIYFGRPRGPSHFFLPMCRRHLVVRVGGKKWGSLLPIVYRRESSSSARRRK